MRLMTVFLQMVWEPFLDVFINYHSGPEGDKLAKWVIEVCQDPKYADIADKLQKIPQINGRNLRRGYGNS